MNVNSQLFKGSLTTIILKLLNDEKRMYGYELTQKVKEITAGKLVLTEGALYPALHKLEADGLLNVSIETIGNRKRKYYSLTPQGKKESKLKLKEMLGFFEQMNTLLQLQPLLAK